MESLHLHFIPNFLRHKGSKVSVKGLYFSLDESSMVFQRDSFLLFFLKVEVTLNLLVRCKQSGIDRSEDTPNQEDAGGVDVKPHGGIMLVMGVKTVGLVFLYIAFMHYISVKR